MNTQPLFTIFTPTYNRAHTIHRVYESLRKQTFQDFEWLIVDDGSTDNTKNIVAAWQKEASFPIRYLWQENKGKYRAMNIGFREGKGEFFLTLDSDDTCTDNALEILKKEWEHIPSQEKKRVCGITVLCEDEQGRVVGDKFPQDRMLASSLEMHYRWRVKGEKWGFIVTRILREHPFPEIEGVKFLSPSVAWLPIAEKYKTLWLNLPLRTYHQGHDQITTKLKSHIPRCTPDYAMGRVWGYQQVLERYLKDWFWYFPSEFFKAAIQYARFGFHSGIELKKQWEDLKNANAKVLWMFLCPVGAYFYIRDKARIKKTNRA
ncbi:MAG: glycosyltransferase family 2 protein [Verrucomicrobiota bacterium]